MAAATVHVQPATDDGCVTWLQAREAELLPCDYYHVVATIPEELRHLFLSDQKFMYSLLMKTVASAVIDLTGDRKYLGATPAILMVHAHLDRPIAVPST